MKAKLINEIVKGKSSGISALGIGNESMQKGYNYVKNTWPDYEDYFDELHNASAYNSKIAKFPEIIDKITKELNVDTNHILQSITTTKKHDIGLWIKSTLLDAPDMKTEIIYLDKSTKHYYIYTSELWGMGMTTVYYKKRTGSVKSAFTCRFYFLRYKSNKYFGI